MGYTFTGACVYMAFFAYLGGSSFVFQHQYGVSATTYSILFAVNALGMLAASQANHRLLARFSPRRLLAVGLIAFAIAGVAVLVAALTGALGLWGLAVPFFVIVASMGVILPDLTALALSLHPEVAGTAAAYFGGAPARARRAGDAADRHRRHGQRDVHGDHDGRRRGRPRSCSSPLTARRTRGQRVLLDLPEEASSDVPVA